MAKLIYFATCSLDGYIADEAGDFAWTGHDPDVHTFVNNMLRRVGTYLFGRRMYELVSIWETPEVLPLEPALMEFAPIWHAAEKIVYSTTLPAVSTAKTRLEPKFDADTIRALKTTATRDLNIGGPNLASHAIRAGLVDEYHMLIAPLVVGGGNPYLPDKVRMQLELIEDHRFQNGMVYVRYGAKE